MERSMLKIKNVPNEFRSEAITTIVYILNISPTKIIVQTVEKNVVFNEERVWDWKQSEVEKVKSCKGKTVIIEHYNEETQPVNQTVSSTKSPSISTSRHSESSSSPSSSSSRSPPRGIRSLVELYESCDFALVATERTSYVKALLKAKW
ncbi:hypothetical protein V2J09_000155 [Rumex salicifolius]